MKKHTITVAALAPDSGDMLACGVYDALKAAPRLLLRTAIHGVADRLKGEGIAFETLDALYEQTEDFDELCALGCRMFTVGSDMACVKQAVVGKRKSFDAFKQTHFAEK